MDTQKLLVQINNQCAVVQRSIEEHYGNPADRDLMQELTLLQKLVDTFIIRKD
jgi:uncharacterized protein (DUF1810 family)